MLGDHPRIRKDGHEVAVPRPAGDDVEVDVACDPRPGALAHVDPDVEAVGVHRLF